MSNATTRRMLLLLAATTVAAQTFEVASVKPDKSGRNGSSTGRSGGQLVFENASLRECIAIAYGIAAGREYALIGPAWIGSERYDIVAKVPAETPREQVLRMLQALLADRFQLRLHRERRDMRVFAIAVARTGAKLKAASASDGGIAWGPGHIAARAQSMTELADILSRPYFSVGAPVIDSTGLGGVFDFTLDWTPESLQPDAAPGPSLFVAIEEQLGLKLEPSKSAVEVLVIDRVERVPTEN
jgi:uncharacterized protein (TIGR03435 family)